MVKLQPTETARVLHSALGCSTFTVEELAERCSANPGTVRTILFRSKGFLEEVETSKTSAAETSRAGRPGKRYRLTPTARRKLSIDLAHLTAEARPREQPPDTRAAVEAALSAAESSLALKADPESANVRADWDVQARSQSDAARRMLHAVRDGSARDDFTLRLSALDHELRPPAQEPVRPRKSWLERLRELIPSPGPLIDPEPAYGLVARTFETLSSQAKREVPCLCFDATEGESDPWSAKIVAELYAARCRPVHLPIQKGTLEDPYLQSELKAVFGEMPPEVPIFVTMRSSKGAAQTAVLRLLGGPLKQHLRLAGSGYTTADLTTSPITVLDYDLASDAFWLDHHFENLRYYPTAQPLLARRLVQSFFAPHPVEVVPAAALPQFTPRPLRGDRLTSAAAVAGFAALEAFAQRLPTPANGPTVLVGVNPGGCLVAQMLWERHRLRADVLINCSCNPRSLVITLDREIPADVSHLIFVDDVVRTGHTMRVLREQLRAEHPQATQSVLALAAVSEAYRGGPLPHDMDFCVWIARDPKLKFPWSGGADRNPSAYFDATGVNQIGGWLPGFTDTGFTDTGTFTATHPWR